MAKDEKEGTYFIRHRFLEARGAKFANGFGKRNLRGDSLKNVLIEKGGHSEVNSIDKFNIESNNNKQQQQTKEREKQLGKQK